MLTTITRITLLNALLLVVLLSMPAGCSYDPARAQRDIDTVNAASQSALDKLDEVAGAAENEVALARAILDEYAVSGVGDPLPQGVQDLVANARMVIEQYPAFVASLSEAKAQIQADAEARIAAINESDSGYELALNVIGFAGMAAMTFLGIPTALRFGKNSGVISGVAQTASIIATGRAVDPSFDAQFRADSSPAATAMKAVLAQLPDKVRDTIRTENKTAKAAA